MATEYSVNPTKITVDYLLKRPQVLDRRFKYDIGREDFITEFILQGGYNVTGGAIAFNRTDPQDLASGSGTGSGLDKENGRRGYEIVAEGGRFPIIGSKEPVEETARAAKHGLRTFLTDEQKRRNQLPVLDNKLRELKSELVYYVDAIFMDKFTTDAGITAGAQTVTDAAGGGIAWTRAGDGTFPAPERILWDLERAKSTLIGLKRGISPDTLLLPESLRKHFIGNAKLNELMEKADQGVPMFSGQTPRQLDGLDLVFSSHVPATKGYVLQRKRVGGYGDEVPTEVRYTGFDEETERHWLKAKRVLVAFIDAPEVCIQLNGIA